MKRQGPFKITNSLPLEQGGLSPTSPVGRPPYRRFKPQDHLGAVTEGSPNAADQKRLRTIVRLFLWILLLQSQGIAQSGWEWQNPWPQGKTLNAVWCRDSLDWTAVGDWGTIVHTSDGGSTWAIQNGIVGEKLNSVCFVNRVPQIALGKNASRQWTGFAVGHNGTILQTSDDGKTWVNHSRGTNEHFVRVRFFDADHGIIVGFMNYNNPGTAPIYRTTDGGTTWVRGESGVAGFILNDVCYTDIMHATIVGDGGLILQSTNGGLTWSRRSTGTSADFVGVFFTNALMGTALGKSLLSETIVVQTLDGGWTWNSRPSIPIDILCVSHSGANTAAAGGNHGEIFRTEDGGATWEASTSVTTNQLWGMHFSDVNHGAAVGGFGTILHTGDGGETWTSISRGPSTWLFGISFFDDLNGVVVGGPGTILHTSNGGIDWVSQSPPLGYEWVTFSHVCSIDSMSFVAVGQAGSIMRTTDAGQQWISQNSGTYAALKGVGFADLLRGIAVGAVDDVQGYTKGIALRTTNGGNEWSLQVLDCGDINAISVVDSNIAIAVTTDGIILRTTDGGIEWRAQVSGTSETLTDVCFVTRDIGTAVGSGGTILRTTDGGSTWEHQPGNNSDYLSGVSFSNADVGTVVSRAFTLRTTDGGSHWEKQDVMLNVQELTAVHQMDDRTATIVGSWGTILHTKTGGATFAEKNVLGADHPISPLTVFQNYPNPFNAATIISFELSHQDEVVVTIHDMLGRDIETLFEGQVSPGSHSLRWVPGTLSSGIYFCRVRSRSTTLVRSLLLLK